MNTTCLLPYCPLPVDTGAKAIFSKHLRVLRQLGECTILSTSRRPVGFGWSADRRRLLEQEGYEILLRTSLFPSALQLYGIGYALICKMLRLEKAFGHANPYHRFAFPHEWLYRHSKGKDLCEIHYSYWARLPAACPKVVIVHDLWSDIMWGGTARETTELGTADLLVTVSHDDKLKLLSRGLRNVHWSPPCIDESIHQDSTEIVVVGSANRHNLEGIRWLGGGTVASLSSAIHCYGGLGAHVDKRYFVTHGSYALPVEPYARCGIVLMLTKEGSGLQIKGVEALAAGRAIIARKGAMRGLPDEDRGWLEVDSPDEMVATAMNLQKDVNQRQRLMQRARAYYDRFLNSKKIMEALTERYRDVSCRPESPV